VHERQQQDPADCIGLQDVVVPEQHAVREADQIQEQRAPEEEATKVDSLRVRTRDQD
jgi:hypothetical protein